MEQPAPGFGATRPWLLRGNETADGKLLFFSPSRSSNLSKYNLRWSRPQNGRRVLYEEVTSLVHHESKFTDGSHIHIHERNSQRPQPLMEINTSLHDFIAF